MTEIVAKRDTREGTVARDQGVWLRLRSKGGGMLMSL